MSISMKLSGTADLKKKLKDGLRKLTDEMAVDYYEALKKYTPYKDGGARSGWRFNRNKKGATIKNKVPYIQRLEEGWSAQWDRQGMTKLAKQQIELNKKNKKYRMNKKRK